MKILIASDLYWPVVNGVSTFSRNLAKGLASRGHEVIVIAPSQNGKKYTEIDDNYTVKRTATVVFPFYQNYRISLTPHREIKKIIDEFKPDIIHIQMLLMIGQATMSYGRKLGIPIVSTNHAMPENLLDNLRLIAPISGPINRMLKRYGIRFYSKSDFCTMPTQAAIDMYGDEVHKLKAPMIAVSNGIDLSRFSVGKPDKKVLAKFNIPDDKPIITFVGRLDAEKHLSVLVKAFNIVLKSVDAKLLLVGAGTDQDELKHLSKKLGISNKVLMPGPIFDAELANVHKVGTVFCMPSPSELQSIATLEAMASGQPVVAVDAGAIKELCQNNRNGFLCEQDNVEQIADGLIKIISDPKLREKMSKESLKIAKTHDIEHTLDTFESIYKKLIANKKALN